MTQSNVITIGVCGGSGSGKTTFAQCLREILGRDNCGILYQDSYYIDQSDRFDADGGSVNFDHPDALELTLMAEHLKQLKENKKVNVPIYEFSTHTRKSVTTDFEPKKYIIADGILIYNCPELVMELDYRFFIDTPEEIRFERRLNRDVKERGRCPDGVKAQFENHVKPMHDLFVEPFKNSQVQIVSGLNEFNPIVQEFIKKI